MEKNGFIQRMRADKKFQSTIKRNIDFTKIFEKYLLENKNRKIEAAIPKDLEDFKTWGERQVSRVFPPTPKEAEHIVTLAKYLEEYVEY